MPSRLLALAGLERRPISHTERFASIAGSLIATVLILMISQYFLLGQAIPLVVASIGASAVLLFALPHSPLSQPWPLIGGHVISAVIGVTCSKLFPNPLIAAPLAIAFAIGVMHYLRCLHPPGGATALAAATGTENIQALGYAFVLTPVTLNVVTILVVAICFNWFFPWRRYPTVLAQRKSTEPLTQTETYDPIAHEDFVYALSQIDSFIDVNEHDLLRIYQLATQRRATGPLAATDIKLGHYYSNGAYGPEWAVRQIIDQSNSQDPNQDHVIYKVVAGSGRRASAMLSRVEFARWAKHEVIRDDENWRRGESDDAGR